MLATTLDSAGAIAAIVAGSIATIGFLGTVGRWSWNRATGAPFRNGIETSPSERPVWLASDVGIRQVDGLGFVLHATQGQAISFKVERCTVTVGDFVSTLIAPYEDHVYVTKPFNFHRHPITLGTPATLPVRVHVEYRVVYRLFTERGRYRRFHERAYHADVLKPKQSDPTEITAIPVTFTFDNTVRRDGYVHRWAKKSDRSI